MDLSCLDSGDIFSLTMWRADGVFTVGVQRRAGDMVRYEKRKLLSEAIEAALLGVVVPKLPY